MKLIFATIVAISFCLVGYSQILPEFGNGKSLKLFNGKNLDGWYQINDNKGPDKNLFAAL